MYSKFNLFKLFNLFTFSWCRWYPGCCYIRFSEWLVLYVATVCGYNTFKSNHTSFLNKPHDLKHHPRQQYIWCTLNPHVPDVVRIWADNMLLSGIHVRRSDGPEIVILGVKGLYKSLSLSMSNCYCNICLCKHHQTFRATV